LGTSYVSGTWHWHLGMRQHVRGFLVRPGECESSGEEAAEEAEIALKACRSDEPETFLQKRRTQMTEQQKLERRAQVERILMDVLPDQCDHPVLAVSIDDDYYVYVLAKYATENEPAQCFCYLASEEIRRVLDGDRPIKVGASWTLLVPGNVNASSTESVQ
jgi:hypothetical protein